MIAIIDYGVGNLFSLKCSFAKIGEEVQITNSEDIIKSADKIILPGVGAFCDAADKLHSSGLDRLIMDEAMSGKPLLGICLGMQLLFDRSFEFGQHKGLGLIKGDIVPIQGAVPPDFKVPHIGWNSLYITNKSSKLFKYIKNGDYVYFVHSYYAENCPESITAVTEYGAKLTACVQNGNIFGCQFHPEKSGDVGLNILKAFCEPEG